MKDARPVPSQQKGRTAALEIKVSVAWVIGDAAEKLRKCVRIAHRTINQVVGCVKTLTVRK